MAIYRIPRGMPWVGDQPRCFMCKHELNMIDYFSIVSYFVWRGTCRYCKGKYECNLGYFFTELLITIGLILCYMRYGLSDKFVLLHLLVVACVIMGVVDAEHKRIPAKMLITTLLIGTLYRTFVDQTFYGALFCGIIGGVLGLGIRHAYFILKGQPKIGYDYTQWQHEDRFVGPGFDYVKLLAITGVFLPLVHLTAFIIIIGGVCLLWRLICAKSFRIGAIMVSGLAVFAIYPEFIDLLINILLHL